MRCARFQLGDELTDLAPGLGARRQAPLGAEQRVQQSSLQGRQKNQLRSDLCVSASSSKSAFKDAAGQDNRRR